MGKKGGDKTPSTTKKGPDMVHQKIKKAKRCLQSSGKRGLDAFLGHYPEIKQNKVVQGLITKAGTLKVRPPKGKRGPASTPKRSEIEAVTG
jgi:hypothetical protein